MPIGVWRRVSCAVPGRRHGEFAFMRRQAAENVRRTSEKLNDGSDDFVYVHDFPGVSGSGCDIVFCIAQKVASRCAAGGKLSFLWMGGYLGAACACGSILPYLDWGEENPCAARTGKDGGRVVGRVDCEGHSERDVK